MVYTWGRVDRRYLSMGSRPSFHCNLLVFPGNRHTLPLVLNIALHPVWFSSKEIICDFCISAWEAKFRAHLRDTLTSSLSGNDFLTALCCSISRDWISLASVFVSHSVNVVQYWAIQTSVCKPITGLLVGLVLECAWLLTEFSKLYLSWAPYFGQIEDLTEWYTQVGCRVSPIHHCFP